MHVTFPPPGRGSMSGLLQAGSFLKSYYPLLSLFQHSFVGCMMYYNTKSDQLVISRNYYKISA